MLSFIVHLMAANNQLILLELDYVDRYRKYWQLTINNIQNTAPNVVA